MNQKANLKKSKVFIWLVISSFLLTGLTGCPAKGTEVAVNVIVVDPTSSNNIWQDARGSIIKRIKSTFGKTTVEGGGFVGSGLDGNIVVLPVSGYTDITSRIPILDYKDISVFKEFVIGSNTSSRASTIYKALLGSKTESFWVNLVDSQIPEGSQSLHFQSRQCQNTALALLQSGTSSSLDRALKYAKDAKSELPAKSCELLGKIVGGITKVDLQMNKRSASCSSGSANRFSACSDVKGSIKAINKLLVDLDSYQTEGTLKTGGCVLFASDMMNFNSDGPLPNWNTAEQARKAGVTDAHNLLPEGFPTMKLGLHVYMPNVGAARVGGKNSEARSNNISAYWEALFDTLNAEVGSKSADTACNSEEFH